MSRLCRRSDRLRCTDAAKVTVRGPDLFGQGIVLADTKTARVLALAGALGRMRCALNAFGLFARRAERRAVELANSILPVLRPSGAVTEGKNRGRATFVHEHQDRVAREAPKPVPANGPTLRGHSDDCACPRLIEG